MKRIATAVAILAAVSSCFAAPPREAESRWVKAAVARFEKDGLLVRYSSGLMDKIPWSNYEAGIATHATSERLKDEVAKAEKEVAEWEARADLHQRWLHSTKRELEMPPPFDKLRAWSTDVDLLIRLTAEFAVEIGSLGVDVPKMQTDLLELRPQLDRLQKRATIAVSQLTWLADIPDTHVVYEVLHWMRRDGMPVGDFGLSGWSWKMGRAYLASWLILGCDTLVKQSEDVQAGIAALKAKLQARPDSSRALELRAELDALTSQVERLDFWAQNRGDLEKAVAFLSDEFRAYGRDPAEIKRQLRVAL
jgi:hypothetical protein